ncbi:hypothetical protein JOE61_000273 [Nocardioides salarius]|uniref:ATP-binding protein n=1 Tax=Nocardioides salarius TaxID=374513 RepID=A0ABS2M5I4_9ACTN|nr:hypothetical protein [Nocardioides salarius]MBM7506459.1 hypothetical protein [Nocardioides salarius]
MIRREDVEQLLAVGNESRSFEVKGPGSLKEKPFVAKVARAVMAMGNRRDGGVVCVGVDEPQMKEMQPGLDDDQASEWADYDNVAAALAKYSDPAVVFELAGYALSSGANVVVLDVAEFDVVPHVCKKTFPEVLQDGMTYVRPRGKPESVPVPNSAEMRALLDLATAKGVREWVRVGTLAGVPLTETKSQEQLDEEEYTKERTTAWAEPSPVVAGLLEIGYFDVAVRPTTYSSGRILPVDLESFVTDNTVRLRGWPLPFVDYRAPRFRKGTMVGQDLEASGVPHHEAWRMWGSGQFLQRRALASDLRDHSDLLPADPSATGAVAVWDVLLYLVEVAEFGARMSTYLEGPPITFDVGVSGVSGRELISGDHRRQLYGPYISPLDTLETHQSVASARLLTEPRQVGVELAQDLLKQFGLNVPDQVLFDYQAQILDPS